MLQKLVLLSVLSHMGISQITEGVVDQGSGDPVIILENRCSQDDSFSVETDADLPSNVYRGQSIFVAAGQLVPFFPGSDFAGALTGTNGTGTRHEVDFRNGSQTFYNCDMELGMDNSTFGPFNGSGEIVGEENCVGKANQAWNLTDQVTQQALLASGYIQGSVGGQVTGVHMNENASLVVIDFLQLTAEFNAYITHGSGDGADMTVPDAVADTKSKSTAINKLRIIRYP